MIRILHVIGIMNRGGAESMIMNLYRNIDRKKVQFDFVENTYEKGIYENEIISLGGRIFHCPKFNGNVFLYMKWWNEFFDKHKNEYTFVHGHIGSTAAMYLASAKKHGIKTIAHSHNTYTKSISFSQLRYRVFSYPTRFISDYFFACGEEAGISRYGKRTVFHVIRNAIDTREYNYQREISRNKRKELQIGPDMTVFGHVGRFNEQKNHMFLLKVFADITKLNDTVILLSAGDGPLREKMEEEAMNIGIADKVRFLGVREDIPELMQCMDVMIFPSLYEGLPVTLVEAQCTGLRCLISDRISDECILTDDLITYMSLDESSEEWAKNALNLSDYERHSYEEAIIKAGYDIKENATWLQSFYLNGGY